MTFTIVADVGRRQLTEKAESPHAAMAWVWEFKDRGAKEVYIRDDKRLYTEAELEKLCDAAR